MTKGNSAAILFILVIGIFLTFDVTSGTSSGAPVNSLVFKVITGDNQQVLALQNDEIDLIGSIVDPSYIPTLDAAVDIGVASTLRNGYGYVTINCEKYPFNITSFRRALAFALDKEKISDEVWDGSSLPQDSVVPVVNPFSIEGQLPYTYYEANVALGNQILDVSGFLDVDNDTIREAPDGSDFDVLIECASSSNIALEVGAHVAEALVALDINATSQPTDFIEYLNRLYFHGDYDICFVGQSFSNFDVDWLAHEYWSENANVSYQNFPNFRNSTFDSWRDQLLYATDYDDVYEAAIEMQKIWVYQSPMIICYENLQFSAYRTDRFSGHINQPGSGVPNWWTFFNVHQALGGGTFRTSIPLDIDSFNFMVSSSSSSELVNMEMWDSLIRIGPDGNDVLWLAESYYAETHDDNSTVPDGYTRFTFEILDNCSWTDGTPLDAEDIAFTLNYYRDSPGNPYGADFTEMTAAYAPSSYTLVVEFGTESYWHLHNIGYKPILPKHVFQSIGLDGWNSWNPNPPTEAMVTSGPFNVSNYVAGENITLSRHTTFETGNEPPTITPHDDIEYTFGSSGNQITWSVSDSNPDTYSIYRNSVPLESGPWTSGSISIDIDGLAIGIYNYTLEIRDEQGQSAIDTVFVEVTQEPESRFGKIVFDYSHGQYASYVYYLDQYLEQNLTALGYEAVWARGGINSSILSDASGLVIGSIYGSQNEFTATEIDAITNWYNEDARFLWVACDSDYAGYSYINDNMNTILSSVNSHVYGEPASVGDPSENAGASYRPLANTTSTDPFVSEIVSGVDYVLMHDPTCLYGSTSANPSVGAVALETTSIPTVYPLLYYGAGAYLGDSDLVPPLAHFDGQTGGFAAVTLELNSGLSGTGVIVTSGASPYGDYYPMSATEYYSRDLQGDLFVRNTIDFGMKLIRNISRPLLDTPDDITLNEGETGLSIMWNINSENPAEYVLFRNGFIVDNGLWTSPFIYEYPITVTSYGEYNFTLFVNDTFGLSTIDTVWVRINDVTPPSLNSPADIQFLVGETGHTINWVPTDNNPLNYIITRNGSVMTQNFWTSGDEIAVILDFLIPGTYIFIITVFDEAGNFVTDSVNVNILDTSSETTTTETTTTTTETTTDPDNIMRTIGFLVTIGSFIVMLFFLILLVRSRK